MPDIYELIEEYENGSRPESKIVARIMDDLNDRRGIKHALWEIDNEVMKEIFEELTVIVGNALEQ